MQSKTETKVWAVKTLAGVTVCEFLSLPLLTRFLEDKKNTQHLASYMVVSIVTTEEVLDVTLFDNKTETDGGALQQVPTGALPYQAV